MTVRALIIGGTGFIGSNAVRRFLAAGAEVAAFGPPVPGADLLADLGERVVRIDGDVREPARLIEAVLVFRPDVVLHLAAYGGSGTGLVKAAQADPVRAVEVNVVGFLNTLEACRICRVPRLVWTSSTAQLGAAERYGAPVVDEDAPTFPASLYGATKVMAEHLARHYRQAFGMEIAGMRPTVVYGPGLWYRGVARAIAELVSAAAAGRPCRLADPSEEWDLLYVKDAAEALYILATAPYAGPELVHVSSHRASLGGMAAAVLRQAPGAPITVEPGGTRLGIPFVETGRARQWGIAPHFDLDAAVADYIAELSAGDGPGEHGGRKRA